jgi:hypothetical protein
VCRDDQERLPTFKVLVFLKGTFYYESLRDETKAPSATFIPPGEYKLDIRLFMDQNVTLCGFKLYYII